MNATTATHDHVVPDEFDRMYDAVRASFTGTTGPLFKTDAADLLFDLYLGSLPVIERQIANCSACRTFLGRYGHLVTIDDDGALVPVMWHSTGSDGHAEARAALAAAVRRARITGALVTPDAEWGTPVTGKWTHLSVHPDRTLVHRGDRASANARAALIAENRGTLGRALSEFDRKLVAQAVTMLEAEALYRSEKVAGPARFLLRLHDQLDNARGKVRENLLWRAAATAPPGFATPRSAMVGTLLEDLAAGMSQAEVTRRFAAKMHPLAYQRPRAAPSAGNVKAAEKLVADMGLEPSLRRRFARLDEIETLWRPAVPAPVTAAGGVFGHLETKGAAAKSTPTETQVGAITWTKFATKVLPDATRIEVHLAGRMSFFGMTTAEDPDAPPILQWDREGARNPFSIYFYNGGSTPYEWGLENGWTDVDAITLRPEQWGGMERPNGTKQALFVLSGARDSRNGSLGLFPENMRSELHAIRSTIEAFSRSGRLSGEDAATANGVTPDATDKVRITTPTGRVVYLIDRWD